MSKPTYLRLASDMQPGEILRLACEFIRDNHKTIVYNARPDWRKTIVVSKIEAPTLASAFEVNQVQLDASFLPSEEAEQ